MKSKRVASRLLGIASALFLILAVVEAYRHLTFERDIIEPIREDLLQRTAQATADIEGFLRPAMEAAGGLAAELSEAALDEEQIVAALRGMVVSSPQFYGGAVAFAPYAFDPERRLFAPYFAKKEGGLEFLQIEEQYDYTEPRWEWYGRAMAEGARWSEPYFDESVGDIQMTTFSKPFYAPGVEPGRGEPRGVVTVDISMEAIRDVVRRLDLGPSGFAMLASQAGQVIHHPRREIVASDMTLSDLVRAMERTDLLKLAEEVRTGGRGFVEYLNPLTGLSSWLVFEPVPLAGWSLAANFIKDDIPIATSALRRQRLRLIFFIFVCLATGLALRLRVLDGGKRQLWSYSTLISLLLIAAIGTSWQAALSYYDEESRSGTPITDPATLEELMEDLRRSSRERLQEPPRFVPTGIYIDAIGLAGGQELELRGYVWQKYDVEADRDLKRGFTIAEVSRLELEEPEVERLGELEVVRWLFEAGLRPSLDFAQYPLMKERARLRLLPADLGSRVLLVPDLAAYDIRSPRARPGLETDIVIPGWDITRTFFDLELKELHTDFGLGNLAARDGLPSLFFNLELRRSFIDAFVSNLIPLIIVAIVVFLVLMISNKEEEAVARLRTGTGFNLSICATLLFVVVFSHIGLRQQISAQEIIYLEYFYIVLYFALLGVAVNSILLVSSESRFIHYQENLLSRVLFWPTILGVLWVVTLATFY